MALDPAHACTRRSRSAIIARGVLQLSRSNSAGETLMPNFSSIIIINSTVLIESSSCRSYRGRSRFVKTSSVSATEARSCNTLSEKLAVIVNNAMQPSSRRRLHEYASSDSWDATVKEIIKSAIVKHPAFGGKVRSRDVLDPGASMTQKSRILVMLLKLDQGKIVALR